MWFGWFQRRRRRQLLAQPLAADDRAALERQAWHYRFLPAVQRGRVDQIVRVLLAEKEWVGAGCDLTRTMQLAIAGYAAVLVSGVSPPFFYERLRTIIVRPRSFRYQPQEDGHDNPYLPSETRVGEAWHRGPVVLSWPAVARAGRSPDNVAIHEFAHHLDDLYGAMDGAPALGDAQRADRWYAVTEAEFLRLVGQAQREEATLLDHYGATDRAEFFAVATECFFQRPHAMRRRHRELYAILADFYRQEPHVWLPQTGGEREADPIDEPPPRVRPPRVGERRRRPTSQAERLPTYQAMEAPDALFTLALDRLDDGDFADAQRILTALLEAEPDDEEALAHRAMALRGLGRTAEALADCDRALDIDPNDVDALSVRGSLRAAAGDLPGALADLDAAVRRAPRDVAARFERGQILVQSGEFRKAIRDLTEVLSLEPYDAEARFLRGTAYQRLGRPRQAAADLSRARLLDPRLERRTAW